MNKEEGGPSLHSIGGPGEMIDKLSNEDVDGMMQSSRRDTRAFIKEPDKVQRILATRGGRYGDYRNNAEVTQSVMRELEKGLSWERLNDMHREGIHMIVHKLARIVNGDPEWHDSWDDIAGYAKLVSDRIPGEKQGT